MTVHRKRQVRPGIAVLLTVVLSLACAGAAAEQFQQFGDLQVHYNVFNSTAISAEMADRYALRRGEDIALVNVAGRRVLEDGSTRAVRLVVEGTVMNLIGQLRETRFDLIEEPEAIYYMLSTRFTDRETLIFELSVTDTETERTYPMRFQKELWKQ